MDSVYRSRLAGKADELASRFRTSVKEDERIFEEDIDGTEAHGLMLYEQGIINKDDLKLILSTLEKLRLKKHRGKVELDSKYEDIHELIEGYVIMEVGLEVGGKIHTGRSRNDQVALDIRMSLRGDFNDVSTLLLTLIETLLTRASDYLGTPMILYTHTQHAQVGFFSHYLLAYVDILFRDLQRLQDCYDRINLSPLGAGPIGGTSIAINRDRTAFLLGFDGILENSIDAVSSRDFMLEAVNILAILMSGISRMAEDLILWSSSEFGFVELDDRFASVSSIMPQKKNPDVLELIRGKTGKIYGNLLSLLTIVKGLTTGYSTDLQETKPLLWDSIDTVKSSLEVLNSVVKTLNVDIGRITSGLSESYAFAVDLTEQLTEKTGLSFREAHMIIGNLVQEMLSQDIKPKDLKAKTVETVIEQILKKKIVVDNTFLKNAIRPEMILKGRKPIGSPSQREVERMLKTRNLLLKKFEAEVAVRVQKLKQSKIRLRDMVKKYS